MVETGVGGRQIETGGWGGLVAKIARADGQTDPELRGRGGVSESERQKREKLRKGERQKGKGRK